MRWKQGRRSSRIEDRRGAKGVKAGGIGIFGIIVVLIGWFMGVDPRTMMKVVETGGALTGGQSTQVRTGTPDQSDEVADFTSVILASTEDAWQHQFAQIGKRYQPTTLVAYDNRVQSACGISSSAVGPFYCPGDKKIYIDFSFLEQMKRMGARGDFAYAYVIAHEVGHHVQNLLGTLPKAHRMMHQSDKTTANQISVRVELQADCYAGMWAHHIRQGNVRGVALERGDLQEGMNAAQAVGDDTISASAGRTIHPENFTHGTAQQRQQWLQRGIQYGDFQQCDTFSR